MENKDLAITISHQLGSGEHLSVKSWPKIRKSPSLIGKYSKCAQQLNILESEVERREERLSTFGIILTVL
jgi:hypothetical protein